MENLLCPNGHLRYHQQGSTLQHLRSLGALPKAPEDCLSIIDPGSRPKSMPLKVPSNTNPSGKNYV
uniref:Uncharacterized protein n=1 Tax=uncultured Gemmatimonadales bacterium HF0130_03D03 TaxID=710742 RepID=E0XSQ9_9BACT|nr:hypothetical protein [uncultured Gemmatimonadales bacterium HF0130_03D03]